MAEQGAQTSAAEAFKAIRRRLDRGIRRCRYAGTPRSDKTAADEPVHPPADTKRKVLNRDESQYRGVVDSGFLNEIPHCIEEDMIYESEEEVYASIDNKKSAGWHRVPDYTVLVAVKDYVAETYRGLSCKQGDKMHLIGDESGDSWLVRHANRKVEGFVPSSYLTKDANRIQSHVSWFDVSVRESERLLMKTPAGTYISRPSSSIQGAYALSISIYNNESKSYSVYHHRVRETDGGKVYFLTKRWTFESYKDLVEYYQKSRSVLRQRLIHPYSGYKPPAHFWPLVQPREKLAYERELGRGNFGVVHKGKWDNTIDVAIKSITMKTGFSCESELLEKLRAMHQLDHYHILPLLGVCVEDDRCLLITELMSKGSLLEVLRSDEGQKMTLEPLLDISAQIADGCAFLEWKSIVHKNLCAGNILVRENFVCKIADDGFAEFKDGTAEQESTKWSMKWTAPEAADNSNMFTTKSDVWSFGIVLWEIHSVGRTPYPGLDPSTVLAEVRAGYRMSKPRFKCPKELYDIMIRCWNSDPESRPRFEFLARDLEDSRIQQKVIPRSSESRSAPLTVFFLKL